MARVSRLGVYMTIYLCLCLVVNVALVVMFFNGHPWTSLTLAPRPWHTNEWDPSSGRILKCSDLPTITNLSIIGSGWTKAVYLGQYGSAWLAVKTVHTTGHDMTECQEAVSVCYERCAAKILREMHLLQMLSHGNVIKVFGDCLPGVEYSPGPPVAGVVAVITELGHPIDVIQVLQMNFEERLKLASDVGRILNHLATSPLGTVLMKDFRREQFVISNGSLKLSDIDDVVIGDPSCASDHECVIKDGVKEDVLVNYTCSTYIVETTATSIAGIKVVNSVLVSSRRAIIT
ncbi:Extracellular tyrosine-protein kinase PKDCC-like, partial [Homarus americanus]